MSNLINTNQNSLFSAEKIELIKKQFFPTHANSIEMEYCFSVAHQYNLDPILKQIFFVPRRSKNAEGKWIEKIEPLVGRDGFLAIAHKSGEFAGIKSWSEVKSIPKLENGSWKNVSDLIAICEVYRKDSDKAFRVEVAYSEYVQMTSSNEITHFWKTKPDTMLKKVAESQALRKAFNLSGLYSPEELGLGIVDENNAVIIDTEAEQNTAVISNAFSDDEKEALKALGLSTEEREGFVKLVGNTYGLSDKIKAFGYKFNPEKKIWFKKIA